MKAAAAMYRGFAILAVIYVMVMIGMQSLDVIFQAGIAWPGAAAMATVLLFGNAGVMVYRGLTMQPDLVNSSHCPPALRTVLSQGRKA
jgi:hypothetical protein